MKVEIQANGMLIIEAENPLEAFALTVWCKDNIDRENTKGNLLINTNAEKYGV